MNIIKIAAILWMLAAYGCAEWSIYNVQRDEDEMGRRR
jgi:hypothetical protein